MTAIYQRACQRIRSVVAHVIGGLFRKPWWRMQGMAIGGGTFLTSLDANWPHKVAIGAGCMLEPGICFKFDGIWSAGRAIVIGDRTFIGRGAEFNVTDRVEIGDDALIGSGCKFIDHNHGISPDVPMGAQPSPHAPIVIGNGAWLGVNVVVLAGVVIGHGAIVGAGAVVSRSVPDFEIWAGVPARRVGSRFDARTPETAVRA